MKKQIKSVMLMTIAALAVSACGPKSDIEGFTKLESGLHYKFIEEHKDAQKVETGDVLVGEIILSLNGDTLFANIGNPGRILQVTEGQFQGDLPEGLLMMHKGDKAVFAVDCDQMAAFFGDKMPPMFKAGHGDKMYYEVNLMDIVTAAEFQAEQEAFYANMQEAQEAEADKIATYVKENNIKVQPNENGVYIIVNKKGNGPKVAAGKQVSVHYTGTLLDGTQFDSSRGRAPLAFVAGTNSMIPGFEQGLMGQTQGSQLTLIIPSKMAYGERDNGTIPPFSTLRFEIEIMSVNDVQNA